MSDRPELPSWVTTAVAGLILAGLAALVGLVVLWGILVMLREIGGLW